jgi:16S rRNA processing protein RimM
MQVVVGRIGKAHGIRGAVTVEVRTDEPEVRFADGAVLATEPPAAGPLVVESTKWHAGRLLVHFEGVHDRNASEALRGTELWAERPDDAAPADPEEFYDSQLVGLPVELADGTVIGMISEIAHLPSQDLLVVAREGASEVLVPFVTAIVTTIDVAGRRVVIEPPDGLIAEDAEPA